MCRQCPVMLALLLLLAACGQWEYNYQGRTLSQDVLDGPPYHWPCQRDMEQEPEARGGVTYVNGPETLIGCVRDSGGHPIKGASIVVPDEPGAISVTTVPELPTAQSQPDGRYQMGMDPVSASWLVEVEAAGYELHMQRVEIRKGRSSVVDFTLQPRHASPTPIP